MFIFRIKFKCECLGSFWIWSIKLGLIFPCCQQSRRSKSSLPLDPCSSLLSSFHRVPPLLALLCSYASPCRLEGPPSATWSTTLVDGILEFKFLNKVPQFIFVLVSPNYVPASSPVRPSSASPHCGALTDPGRRSGLTWLELPAHRTEAEIFCTS